MSAIATKLLREFQNFERVLKVTDQEFIIVNQETL